MMTCWRICNHPVPAGHPSFLGGELAGGSSSPEKGRWPKAGGVISLLVLIVASFSSFAQTEEEETPSYNQEKEHGVSLGVSISSFNRNITYLISPAYHFRIGKHQIMVNPFVGRLDEVNKQFDFGFGLNYRVYPFKNRNLTRAFFQVGADYVFQDNPSRSAQSMLYRFGPGMEVSITDRLTGGINIDLAILQQLSAESKNSESPDTGFDPHLRFKVLPFIRFAYAFSKKCIATSQK